MYDTIDRAIESRIHVHLQFPPLPPVSRSRIWANFLRRLPESLVKIDHKEIEDLGFWTLNGRDIKNAVKMTMSWCEHQSKVVTFSALEEVISATCPRAGKQDVTLNRVLELKVKSPHGSYQSNIEDLIDI